MICCKCDKNLEHCTCTDLKERIAEISKSPYVIIGPDYLARIEAQAERNLKEQSKAV